MRTKFMAAVLAGVAGLALAAPASAAIVFRTYEVTATNFVNYGGASPPTSVSLNVTVEFDNGADISNRTSGLTVNAFSLPYAVTFGYDQGSDTLSFGSSTGPGSCGGGANTFCVFIAGASGGSPSGSGFLVEDATGFYAARSSTVTFAPGTPADPGVVPEPGTWAMMLAGFGGLGAMLRRRRAAALAA